MVVLNSSQHRPLWENARDLLAGFPFLGGEKSSDFILRSPDFSIACYTAGETIACRRTCRHALAFILSGSAVASKTAGGRDVVIRLLKKGDLFGIASLFGGPESYVSEIRARKTCYIAFVPQQIVAEIFRRDSDAAMAYIALLSEKIRYLNAKLDGFAAPSAYAKLCLYLLENGDTDIPIQTLAQTLGISRMTLYRNLELLAENRSICRNGRSITVLDRESLALGADSDPIL